MFPHIFPHKIRNMVHRFNNRGTLVIDKQFKAGIGRIRKAYGTNSLKTFNHIRFMLGELYDSPQHHEILEEIRDDVVSILDV